jgi:hypothetical protein
MRAPAVTVVGDVALSVVRRGGDGARASFA